MSDRLVGPLACEFSSPVSAGRSSWDSDPCGGALDIGQRRPVDILRRTVRWIRNPVAPRDVLVGRARQGLPCHGGAALKRSARDCQQMQSYWKQRGLGRLAALPWQPTEFIWAPVGERKVSSLPQCDYYFRYLVRP